MVLFKIRYKAIKKGGEEFSEYLHLYSWPSDFLKIQKKKKVEGVINLLNLNH